MISDYIDLTIRTGSQGSPEAGPDQLGDPGESEVGGQAGEDLGARPLAAVLRLLLGLVLHEELTDEAGIDETQVAKNCSFVASNVLGDLY